MAAGALSGATAPRQMRQEGAYRPLVQRRAAHVMGFGPHAEVHRVRDARLTNPPAVADLAQRVFRIDVLQCERCGGEMKVLALVTEQAAISKILERLDLPLSGPPIAKARRHPEFDFVG